jgi:hypothetical protein
MSYAYYECGFCEKPIELEQTLDAHFDDSGEYHYECYQDWSDKESAYWSALYHSDKSNQFKLSRQEQLDAYDPGSAKRYALGLELSGN